QLGPADVGSAVQNLALEVAEIDDVEIDKTEPANAGGGEVERQRRAESAGADKEDRRRLESFLSLDADLGHDQMPAVALDFLRGKVGGLSAGGECVVETHGVYS